MPRKRDKQPSDTAPPVRLILAIVARAMMDASGKNKARKFLALSWLAIEGTRILEDFERPEAGQLRAWLRDQTV